jgi:2-polyprenyl-6-methoxyphenol hydroxylase-like FAD-dependent oxidoreductase
MFAATRPVGPCAFYPMNDSWTDSPCAPGAVLVGDAAGWSDPIIGQGLSIAMRDARMVAEILRSTRDWGPAALAEYAAERSERMRRLRIAAQVSTDLHTSFGPAGAARRRAYLELMATDPVLAGARTVTMLGPDRVPAESFEKPNIDRIRALS